MKRYILTVLSALLLTACSLDIKPTSELTYNGFWDSEEAVRSAHIGLHARFRNFAYTFWTMGELRADSWGGLTIESAFDQNIIDNNFSPTQAPFNNWAGFYGYIHQINDFIKNAPGTTFANESEKNNMLAQAYGMRAFIYYTMLKAWGDVIITTEPLTDEMLKDLTQLKRPRAPKAEVMAQVLSDIEESLKLYSGTSGNWKNMSIYWSKNATLALKGDALLWKGQVLGGGKDDFRKAKEALQAIKGHSLVPYDKLWGVNNEKNNEFIFSLDYQQDQAQNFYQNFTARSVDVEGFFDLQGESLKKYYFNGANRYGVSPSFLKNLFSTPDRRQESVILVYTKKGNHDPKLVEQDETYRGSILNKFTGELGTDGVRRNFENIPIYRYADVLLMIAEAKNQLGEDPSKEVNMIRERSSVSGQYVPFVSKSKIENKRTILAERQKELIGEGKRWWDLVRAGDNLVFEYVKNLKQSESYKIYYPISNGMIAQDPDTIKQTEGY